MRDSQSKNDNLTNTINIMKSEAEEQQNKSREMENTIQNLYDTIQNMMVAEAAQNKTVNRLKDQLASKDKELEDCKTNLTDTIQNMAAENKPNDTLKKQRELEEETTENPDELKDTINKLTTVAAKRETKKTVTHVPEEQKVQNGKDVNNGIGIANGSPIVIAIGLIIHCALQ